MKWQHLRKVNELEFSALGGDWEAGQENRELLLSLKKVSYERVINLCVRRNNLEVTGEALAFWCVALCRRLSIRASKRWIGFLGRGGV